MLSFQATLDSSTDGLLFSQVDINNVFLTFDSLGRPFLTRAHAGFDASDDPIYHETRLALDIEGNELSVTDALDRTAMTRAFDRRKNPVVTDSIDAGKRWTLPDVSGNPVRAWDDLNRSFRMTYDALRRPTGQHLTDGAASEIQVTQTVYGETPAASGGPADAMATNHRGQVYQIYDGAGVLTNDSYDFKGNVLSTTRQLAVDYKNALDWSADPAPTLETDSGSNPITYVTEFDYDALNRVIEKTTPDDSVTKPTYNEAGLLESLSVNVRGSVTATDFIDNIDYDAHGRRTKIEYANDVTTEYAYDDETFRLTDLTSTRTTDSAVLQDLTYTYDPIGNITTLADAAQDDIYFGNTPVSAGGDYTYDPLYRLTQATGREHPGQVAAPAEMSFAVVPHPNSTNVIRSYTETYEYDAVGNITEMDHAATNGNWTRDYTYTTGTNRLASSIIGAGPAESHTYDAHGNMESMAHLSAMNWDFFDRLSSTVKTSETTYYVYDASGRLGGPGARNPALKYPLNYHKLTMLLGSIHFSRPCSG